MEDILQIMPQENTGMFNFNLTPAGTKGFRDLFKTEEECSKVVYKALAMIDSQYSEPGQLQRFIYGIQSFYVVSNQERGKEAQGKPQVTFLLPREIV